MTFYQRMIAASDRQCSQCEDEVPEGDMYMRAKNEEIWCLDCVSYEQNRED